MKEQDSPVVVLKKCIAVSRKNFMVVKGFVHVCFAASQKDIQHIKFFLLSAKKLCYTIKLNRCWSFTLFIRPSV